MRQTLKATGVAALLLLTVSELTAEPLVKGFFVEKLPANSQNKALAPGKGLVLAHVLNQSDDAISKGSYQIGVQIEDKGNIKTYSLTPKSSITPGALKTFRMAVPVEGIDKASGQFRVFSRVNGVTTWSEKYSFLEGIQSSPEKNGVTTLYTEAPAENEKRVALKEVPFETDSSSVKNTTAKSPQEKKAVENSSKKVAEPAKTVVNKAETKAKTEVAKVKAVAETKVASSKPVEKVAKGKTPAEALKQLEERKAANKAKEKSKVAVTTAKSPAIRKINPSEFKKLKTMDEELIIYVVKEGDTLRSISENYYGNASKERSIADLNFIEKSSAVRVGEEIIVEVRPLKKNKG